ncbi:MAG TPA: hypothetical protein VHL58_15680 [Thermoanaerobaculia bacterium]|nr:hypothetical protein [Thermoanaerobaculia bacterium]
MAEAVKSAATRIEESVTSTISAARKSLERRAARKKKEAKAATASSTGSGKTK